MGNAPKEELCRQLVHLSMGGDDRDRTANLLKAADDAVWKSALRALLSHDLLPLIAYSLRTQSLEPFVPTFALSALRKIYRDTCLINQRYLSHLGEILELFRARGINPVVWKGCVLADSVWPDIGTRPIGDLDLAFAPSETVTAVETLVTAGYQPVHNAFISPSGICVDIKHAELAGDDLKGMTWMLTPRIIPMSTICCLEPATMLARLACHLARHSDPEAKGIHLRWMLDLHFILRRWGGVIDATRLAFLTDTDIGLAMLMRTVGFFCGEMGMRYEGCEELESLGAQFEPLTFREILRSRRLGVWGLPTAETGWLCLFAHCLRVHTQSGLTVPLLSDFANIIPDIYRKRRMSRRAAALRQQLAATQSSQ